MAIHPFSVRSLALCTLSGTTELSNATGFLISGKSGPLLVTNYHVLTGKNPFTREYIHPNRISPDRLRIVLRHPGKLSWDEDTIVPLFRDGVEQFVTSREVDRGDGIKSYLDVAILPFKVDQTKYELDYIDLDGWENKTVVMTPMQDVAIVGFPFGLSSNGALPIWKSGQIASEPSLSFQGYPAILVDAATRGGMSGSPTYYLPRPPYQTVDGNTILAGGQAHFFLGIYSGRLLLPPERLEKLHKEHRAQIEAIGSDLGLVWGYEAIRQVMALVT